LAVGIVVLVAIAFLVLGLVSDLLIPLSFAAILAAIFVPLVDRLERWRLPRWLGAPLVVPIALVNFVTSYIPFYGAFFAGAFAVLIAVGANGVSVAVAMLAITLLTNTLQNLLEPLVFGTTLRLYPLVVMLDMTAGTLLFGLLGATLAVPVTAVALRTVAPLRESGLFAQRAATSGRSKAPA
jgi:putative heme transporter